MLILLTSPLRDQSFRYLLLVLNMGNAQNSRINICKFLHIIPVIIIRDVVIIIEGDVVAFDLIFVIKIIPDCRQESVTHTISRL